MLQPFNSGDTRFQHVLLVVSISGTGNTYPTGPVLCGVCALSLHPIPFSGILSHFGSSVWSATFALRAWAPHARRCGPEATRATSAESFLLACWHGAVIGLADVGAKEALQVLVRRSAELLHSQGELRSSASNVRQLRASRVPKMLGESRSAIKTKRRRRRLQSRWPKRKQQLQPLSP